MKSENTLWSSNLAITIITIVLVISAPAPVIAEGKVLGLSFVDRHVANLERTVEFYQTLGFQLSGEPSGWKVDKEVNKLGGTPGVESRTAVMTMQSSVSDVPMGFTLREFRGLERNDWSNLTSFDLLSGHMDLTVMDDCQPWLDKLESKGLLNMPEDGSLPRRKADDGSLRFVFIQDPDGWYVELFALNTPVPGEKLPVLVSNSTATMQNIDRTGYQEGFNHVGLNVVNAEKAQHFYEDILGGDYPSLNHGGGASSDGTPRMVMMHGWFPQATTDKNLRVELIKFPQNEGKQPPAMKITDIGITIVGFQVEDIDAVYASVVAAGAITLSEGGIQNTTNGRTVLLRDPDAGGFLQLWEPAN